MPDARRSMTELYDLSHFVAEIANLAPDEYQAYVGQAAFAHKGGVHVSAMRRSPLSYQHIEPEPWWATKCRWWFLNYPARAISSARPRNMEWLSTAAKRLSRRAQSYQGIGITGLLF